MLFRSWKLFSASRMMKEAAIDRTTLGGRAWKSKGDRSTRLIELVQTPEAMPGRVRLCPHQGNQVIIWGNSGVGRLSSMPASASVGRFALMETGNSRSGCDRCSDLGGRKMGSRRRNQLRTSYVVHGRLVSCNTGSERSFPSRDTQRGDTVCEKWKMKSPPCLQG